MLRTEAAQLGVAQWPGRIPVSWVGFLHGFRGCITHAGTLAWRRSWARWLFLESHPAGGENDVGNVWWHHAVGTPRCPRWTALFHALRFELLEDRLAPATLTLTGHAQWFDTACAPHPIPFTDISVYQVLDGTSNLEASVTTDANGNYQTSITWSPELISGNSTLDFRAVISSQSHYAQVENASGTLYTMTSEDLIVTSPTDGATYTLPALNAGSPTYSSANDTLQRAFSVDSAAVTGGEYVTNDFLTGSASSLKPIGQVTIVLGAATTGFTSATNTIGLVTQDGYDWDVILHEYGHFVASTYGFLANAPGTHSFGHESLGLAWNEGWATYFGLAAENALADQPYVQNVPGVNGPIYDDTEDQSIHINLITQVGIGTTYNGTLNYGEDEEMAVAAALYELSQSGFLNGQTLFSDIQSASALTMGQAWDAIAGNLSVQDKTQAGEILAIEGMSPGALSTTTSTTQPTTFTWDVTAPNGLNTFLIEFFSGTFNPLGTLTINGASPTTVNATTVSYSFTPTSSEWNNVLAQLPASTVPYTLEWVVQAQNTNPPSSYGNGGATTPGTIPSSTVDFYWSDYQTVSAEYSSSTLSPTDQSELLSGLQGVGQSIGTSLDNDSSMAQALPVTGQSVGQGLDFGDTWQSAVVNPLTQPSQSGGPAPTYNSINDLVAGLHALNQSDPVTVTNVTGGLQGDDIVFSLDLQIAQTKMESVNLGSALSALNLGLDASTQVSVTTTLNMDFSFGIDLSQVSSPTNAFFINVSSMSVGVTVAASNLNFGIHEGFLDAGVTNGTIDLDASIGMVFTNPNTSDGSGNITLSSLQGNPISSIVTLQPSGSLYSYLPLSVNGVPGISIDASAPPALFLSDTNLFNGSAPSVNLDDPKNQLTPFANLSAGDFSTLLTNLGSSLQDIVPNLNPSSIPLISQQISDIIDLTQTTTNLANQLQRQVLVGYGNLPANFQLGGDANFSVAIGSAAPVAVDLSQSLTQNDASINDLATAINTALANANLSSSLEAVPSNGLIELMAINSSVTAFTISSANSVATNLLGFGNSDGSAQPITLQALLPVLAGTLDIDPSDLGVNYDPTTESFTFNVDFKDNYSQSVFLNFGNSLGPLTIAGSATATFGAAIEVKGTLGINLGSLTADPTSLQSDIFLANNPTVTASANVSAPAINLSAALGILSVGVKNGNASVTIGAGLTLTTTGSSSGTNPPNTLALSEVASASSLNSSFLTIQPITASVTGTLHNPATLLADLQGPNGLLAQLNADIAGLSTADQALIAMAPSYLQTLITQSGQAAQNQFSSANDAFFSAATAALGALQDSISSLPTADQASFSTFLQNLESDIPGVQNLGPAITKALGLPAGSVTVTFAKVPSLNNDQAIEILLHLTPTASQTLSLDNLSIPGVGLLTFASGGTVVATVGGSLELDFGYDMTSNTPFRLPTTAATLTASITSSNLMLSASLGGFQVASVGYTDNPASITLGDSAKDGNPAKLAFTLNTGNNAQSFSDILSNLSSDVDVTFDWDLSANLPIQILTTDVGTITADVNAANLGDPSTWVDTSQLNLSQLAANFDFSSLTGGLTAFLTALQTALQSNIIGQLPLVGSDLNMTGGFIQKLNDDLVTPLTTFDWPSTSTLTASQLVPLQKLILDELGSPTNPPAGDAHLGILVDANGNPVTTASQVDVYPDSTTGNLVFDLDIKGTDTYTSSFNLGLQGLPLTFSTTGGVTVGLNYGVGLEFELSKTDGFYFDVSGTSLAFGVSASLTPGTNFLAQLFSLGLSITSNTLPPGTPKAGKPSGFPSDTYVSASLMVTPSDPEGDGKIRIADMGAGLFGASFTAAATANIDLHLVANIAQDPNLPSFSTDLLLSWTFGSGSTVGNAGSNPTGGFYNIQLNLGDFISKTIGPIMAKVETYLGPIQPILSILNTDIPVISDLYELLGQGPLTFADAISEIGTGGDALGQLVSILSSLDSLAPH